VNLRLKKNEFPNVGYAQKIEAVLMHIPAAQFHTLSSNISKHLQPNLRYATMRSAT
jgi:hypothetical protein